MRTISKRETSTSSRATGRPASSNSAINRPSAPTNGSDHNDLHNSLRGTSTPAYITGRVNLDLWCRYHAFAEAIRHYDYWPSGDNNAAYYFYPNYNAANNNKGVMWWLPYDVDATWGPTWNNGHDLVHNPSSTMPGHRRRRRHQSDALAELLQPGPRNPPAPLATGPDQSADRPVRRCHPAVRECGITPGSALRPMPATSAG